MGACIVPEGVAKLSNTPICRVQHKQGALWHDSVRCACNSDSMSHPLLGVTTPLWCFKLYTRQTADTQKCIGKYLALRKPLEKRSVPDCSPGRVKQPDTGRNAGKSIPRGHSTPNNKQGRSVASPTLLQQRRLQAYSAANNAASHKRGGS